MRTIRACCFFLRVSMSNLNAPYVLNDHLYDNRNLLTEDYIRLIRMVTKVQKSAFQYAS